MKYGEIVLRPRPLRNKCTIKAKESAHNQHYKGIIFLSKVVTVLTSAATSETSSKHIQKGPNDVLQVKNSRQNSSKRTR